MKGKTINTLCVAILTYNESQNIDKCIKAIQEIADEMLIIDSFSTDDTVAIAESLGAKVCLKKLEGDFAAQRNFALENTDMDYILYIDADEFATPELCSSISEYVRAGENVALKLKRCNIAFGEHVKYGVLAPDYVARLFPRNSVNWVGKVHEKPVYNLPEKVAQGFLWHHTYKSWEQYWRKFDVYTTICAEQDYERGKRTTKAQAVLHALGAFFKMFVLKKGFMDGYIGWVLCCNHFSYTLAKYNKLYLLQQKQS